MDNLQGHSNGLKINIYSYQLPSFLKSARDISTRIITCVHRAPFMNARSLSDDGSRPDFHHLYFWRFKLFLIHSMDILLSPIGDLTNIHKNFLTTLPERRNCLTSVLVGVMESRKRTSFTPSKHSRRNLNHSISSTFCPIPFRCWSKMRRYSYGFSK